MQSTLYNELRDKYSIRKEVAGAFLVALILIGGAYAHVRGEEVKRELASLEAKACLIP